METNRLIIRSPRIIFYLLFLSLIVLVPMPCLSQALNESSDQIWAVGDNRWTVEEEYRFGRWVDENITEDFLFAIGLQPIVRMPSMRFDGFMLGSPIFPLSSLQKMGS